MFLPDYSDRPAQRNPYFLGGVGLVVAGLLVRWNRTKPDPIEKALPPVVVAGPIPLTQASLTDAQAAAFKRSLPALGQQYADMFVRAGRAAGVSPFILAGLMEQETRFGKGCRDAACRGYGGGDYGLMQINRIHKDFFTRQVNGRPAYEDPWSSIEYGANLFASYQKWLARKFPKMTDLELLRATAASYNAGSGAVAKALAKGNSPDSVTTGYNYGKSVMQRATGFLAAAAQA